jgi:hypothetical protein
MSLPFLQLGPTAGEDIYDDLAGSEGGPHLVEFLFAGLGRLGLAVLGDKGAFSTWRTFCDSMISETEKPLTTIASSGMTRSFVSQRKAPSEK